MREQTVFVFEKTKKKTCISYGKIRTHGRAVNLMLDLTLKREIMVIEDHIGVRSEKISRHRICLSNLGVFTICIIPLSRAIKAYILNPLSVNFCMN